MGRESRSGNFVSIVLAGDASTELQFRLTPVLLLKALAKVRHAVTTTAAVTTAAASITTAAVATAATTAAVTTTAVTTSTVSVAVGVAVVVATTRAASRY